jgi:hypothetical protein
MDGDDAPHAGDDSGKHALFSQGEEGTLRVGPLVKARWKSGNKALWNARRAQRGLNWSRPVTWRRHDARLFAWWSETAAWSTGQP